MILAIEPVFPNAHHAPGNAGILRALLLIAGAQPVTFAAHPSHRAAVADLLGPELDARVGRTDFPVSPPGGVKVSRIREQFQAMRRLASVLDPSVLIVVGTTSETLFACRLLAMTRRNLPILAVLHGNLSTAAIGWRSRDPRHRLFDSRSALRVARHPAIRFVVLDESIRQEAVARGLLPEAATVTWPQPIEPAEVWDTPHQPRQGPIHIGFVGSAHRNKGFGDFLKIARHFAPAADRYRFTLAGGMMETYSDAERELVGAEYGLLDRVEYLRRIRGLDYVCLPVDPEVYALTASGSLLDAVAALKPVIAYPGGMVKALASAGPIGFTCEDLNGMMDVVADHDALRDPAAYGRFQDSLRRQRTLRSPDALAGIIANTLWP